MLIRKAQPQDAPAIVELLDQLDYPNTAGFMESRIRSLGQDPDEALIVGEQDGRVIAVVSLHFIPQLALERPFARISYFSVHAAVRSQGIGRQLEQYVEAAARSHGCDRIEVHCHSRRKDAHRFYEREGYHEDPKYFIKKLN